MLMNKYEIRLSCNRGGRFDTMGIIGNRKEIINTLRLFLNEIDKSVGYGF